MPPVVKSFEDADQVADASGVREELVTLGDHTVGRVTHQPGWRWSTHTRPTVGTERCQTRHVGVVISGRMGVELTDGTILDIGPDTVFDIPPGHDGWTVGPEPLVTIDWTGVREWLVPAHGERVLATILFTDIVDSTGSAKRLGDRRWRSILAAHDETTRSVLAQSNGRTIKATGDGFLALLTGPAQAIDTAVALRRAIRQLGLELRQAVHIGEVELSSGDLRGVAVHEAARIMAAADPGAIFVSSVTQALATGSGFTFEPRGSRALKGLPGTYDLYAVAEDVTA